MVPVVITELQNHNNTYIEGWDAKRILTCALRTLRTSCFNFSGDAHTNCANAISTDGPGQLMRIVAHAPASLLGFPSKLSQNTRSERCILVKYLCPVIYWRLYKVRVGVRDRSYNIRAWNYNCSKLLE